MAAVIYAERRIAPLLEGDLSGDYTTRIYSAPRALRVSDPVAVSELRERLARLRYERRPEPPAGPGQFREHDGVFQIYLRPLSLPATSAAAALAEIRISESRVRSLRILLPRADAEPAAGPPLLEAVLEPELLFEVAGSKRVRRQRLKDSDIPPKMVQALIAVEDKRFYEHFGLDPRGLGRALLRDVRQLRLAEGGSTLTQQLARALFLSPERTFSRKVKEALLAVYLECRFSKAELMHMYLDSVYFGQHGPVAVVGLSEAARHYFDKDPRALTLGECAMLAGLLRSPGLYNPFRNPDDALDRRRVVLAAMRRQGIIAPKEEAAARLEPLKITRSGQSEPRAADYFVAYVERELRRAYPDEAILTRGITVYTTLDPWLQALATAAVRRGREQASLVALDPRSGAIRALVGGKDYATAPFDRATLALRQPGSAFKPILYAAALAGGSSGRRWTPADLLEDSSRQYRIPGGSWTPRNFDRTYRGRVPLRDALAESLNAASVSLAADLGAERIIDTAHNLGIASPLRPELGLALGASEVTLLELTGAYCAFANGGERVDPYGIETVLDASGEVLSYRAPPRHRVLSPAEAYVMTRLLRAVVTDGTGRALKDWGLEGLAGGKTGTSDDGKDAWFVGYVPSLAAGVWTGSDEPAPLGLTGASAALPIWADFVRAAAYPLARPLEPRQPVPDPWPVPDGVAFADVDPASGLLAGLGCPASRREAFVAGTEPKEKCPLHEGGVAGWLRSLLGRRKAAPAPDPRGGR